jgi:predicted methyltransferase
VKILWSIVCMTLLIAGFGYSGAFARETGIPKYVAAAVADSARPAADTQRDANRKPAETLAFAGVKPGDKILELAPGKGYFTRMLSEVVGPDGRVTIYLLGPLPKPDALPPPILVVAADRHYSNVNVVMQRLTEAKPSGVFDLVWTTQNYHDFHNLKDLDIATINRTLFEALKPGGTYLVVDHVAEAGSGTRDTNTLHRIDPEAVKQELKAAGFVFVGESKMLRNASDPHSGKVFEGTIQGNTDQFVLKFRKPKK